MVDVGEEKATSAKILTARLQEKLIKHNRKAKEEGHQYDVWVSIGSAVFDPNKPGTIDELLAEADQAMYKQKQKGSE